MQKLIVFEIDNVLADLDGGLSVLADKEFGIGGKDEKEFFKFLDNARKNPNIYYGLKPNRPMVDLFLDLQASGYPVGVFSSRPLTALRWTSKWLKTHLMAEPVFIHCGIADKSDFLFEIRDSLQFVIDSDPKAIQAMKADGYPVLACRDDIHPCLYARKDGTVMLWQKVDKESVPLFEYLNELE